MMMMFCSSKLAGRAIIGCALSVACLLQQDGMACAQTLLDTVALYQEPSIRPDGVSSVQASEVVLDTAKPPRTSLRLLPASRHGLRLDGELSTLDWQIYMTSREALETRRLRLAYASAASVLPDVSRLSLRINDVAVGQSSIAAPGEVKPVEFNIEPNVLHEGFNTVVISAEQRHRVDCSVDATYELWTDIDPSRTGFMRENAERLSNMGDLAALRFRTDGSLVIRVLVDGPLSPKRVDQAILAAQAIALLGSYQQTIVSFSRDDEADFGINLVIRTATGLSSKVASIGTAGATRNPPLLVQNERAGFAPTLFVNGADDDELAKAVSELVGLATANITDAASAPSAQKELTGGETHRLVELGRPDIAFSGRFARVPIDFRMPFDFLAADYGKLTLDLTGNYPSGLSSSAQLQIRLNGRDTASVPLSGAAGGTFHHRGIVVPLSALRPGRNTIEIAAKLPNRDDQACGRDNPLDSETNRFVLLGESDLRLPALARIGQLPDLSQTMAGGYPFSIAGSHPKLYVPMPDRDALAAAMTLAVQLSVAAGRPIAFETAISNPPAASGHGLLVAPARALDPELMRRIGMDPDAIRRAWEGRTQPPHGSVAPKSDLSFIAGSIPTVRPEPKTFWSLPDGVSYAMTLAHNWLSHTTATSPKDIDAAADLIVAQGYQSDDSHGAITVVTAPDSLSLRNAVEALASPERWSGPRGRLTNLNATAEVIDSLDASNTRFIETQPLSFGNSRLILAAWLSFHPAIYTMSALILAAILAFTTRLMVKNVGRRNA